VTGNVKPPSSSADLQDDAAIESGPSGDHSGPRSSRSELFLERLLGRFRQRGRSKSRDAARDARQIADLCHALLSERGEVSGVRRAVEILDAYRSLDSAGLELFFDRLVEEFSPNPSQIGLACDAYKADPSQVNLVRLRMAVESPRQELFRRFNMTPGATAVLVDLRKQLLKTLASRPERIGLDVDLTRLFRSWFNRGFLVLQRIDWRTSALVLERLIEHEAVHQVQGWRDLRRRLEADRRCYAFFHPALPDEPLIFIEVALTTGMAARVQPLLDPDAPVVDPAQSDCAIFYSITNCQEGLRGVSFGNFLIKHVVEDLGREFPRLRTFATLSPIPGFTKWLASESDAGRSMISSPIEKLVAQGERGDPIDVAGLDQSLRDAIRRLCAHYLLHAKDGDEPFDPVARFHLTNGARLERLNWMGDTSPSGIRRSLGLMVNYVYRLNELEKNHEAYAARHQIAASADFHRLVTPAGRGSRSLRKLAVRPRRSE
jgi:malonyl-CoA decarboxylase